MLCADYYCFVLLQWGHVANELGTGRTAIAYMMHFKLIERRSLGQGRFTADEEQRLLEGMKLHGRNWPEVAAHVGGHRTRQQVAHHWRDHMTPKRKGKWTEEEDQLLIQVGAEICAVLSEKKWLSERRLKQNNKSLCRYAM